MFVSICLSVIFFLVFLSAHVFIFHFFPPKRRFRSLITILGISLILYTAAFLAMNSAGLITAEKNEDSIRMTDMLAGIFIYFFLYYAYFHQVIVFDRSITPRMMVEIENSPSKKVTLSELKKLYSVEEKFRKELDDMIFMERMEKEGSDYKNTKKGITHARVMQFLRDFLHIGGHQ